MNTPHPQADILRAIANGKQMRMRIGSNFEDVTGDEALKYLLSNQDISAKPETITINGIKVDPPVREPLQKGGVYFLADLYNESFVTSRMWTECSADTLWLGRGLIHLTPEAAIAHAKALLSFTRGDK